MPRSSYFLGDWKDVKDGEFVVARAFLSEGETLEPGTTFEKDSVAERRLRLLYESRYITTPDSLSAALGGTVEREEEPEAFCDAPSDENALSGDVNDKPESAEDIPVDADEILGEPEDEKVGEPDPEATGDSDTPEELVSDQDEVAIEDTETVEEAKRTGKVVEGKAGWFHVEDGDGNKVGKSTRDEDEAKENLELYLLGEDFED